MHKATLVIYQDIDSGAKVVTEEVLTYLHKTCPEQRLIIHRQNPQKFSGAFSAIKNFAWSLIDCLQTTLHYRNQISAIYTSYFLAALVAALVNNSSQIVVFHFHGDHAITRIRPQPGWFGWLKHIYIWIFGRLIAYLQFLALNFADRLIFVAPEAYQQIKTKYQLKRHPSHISIIPNGVSTDCYHPTHTAEEKSQLKKVREQLKLNPFDITLLYSGRIDEKKGIHHILDAMVILKTEKTNLHCCLIVMHPSYRDKDSAEYINSLKQTVKRHRLGVKFVTQPQSLADYYRLADLCLLPSEQEMMPLVMLESLSCGTPFFGPNHGNIANCLRPIHSQLVLPTNNGHVIAEKIKWWQEMNLKQKQQLKQRCVKTAAQYSWQATAQSVLAAISEPV